MGDMALTAEWEPVLVDRALRIEELDAAAWDAQVHLFDDVCQEQLNVFASERWPAMQLDRLNFYDGNRLVAGCLIMHREAPMGLGGLAVCKWGRCSSTIACPARAMTTSQWSIGLCRNMP